MLLSDFIARSIEDASPSLRKQRVKVGRSMEAFFGDRWEGADLLELALPGFAEDYGQFILSTYIPTDNFGRPIEDPADKLADIRCKRRETLFTRLRGMLKDAMTEGLFPAVDIFRVVPDFRSRQRFKSEDAVRQNLLELARIGRGPDKSVAEAYLICLSLGGVSPEKLIELADGSDLSASALVRLPHLDVEVPVDRDLIERLANDERRLASVASTEKIAGMMRARSLALFRAGNVFTDWLIYAVDRSLLSDDDASHCVAAYLSRGEVLSPELARKVGHVCRTLYKSLFPQGIDRKKPFWSVVMTEWPETAEKLENRIFGRREFEGKANEKLAEKLERQTYCPCRTEMVRTVDLEGKTITRKSVDPRRSVLKNMLFVHAGEETLKLLGREYSGTWVMRNKGGGYVRIRPDELDFMRQVLNTLGSVDEVDIIIGEDKSSACEFAKNAPVRLIHPYFSGKVAVVTVKDKSRSTDAQTFYKVQFTSDDGKQFRLSMPADLLRPLIERPTVEEPHV